MSTPSPTSSKSPDLKTRLALIANSLKRLMQVTPRESKMTAGVDIGSSAVKVVALGAKKGAGPRLVLGQNLVSLQPGQDVDASNAIKTAVSALNLPLPAVNLSVSGQWVIMRVIEMPNMAPGEMKQALPFEAQRYLPFNLQEVLIDGALLGPAEAGKMWVLIVACRKELIERRIDWARRAGLEVGLIDVDALALTNSFLATRNGESAEATYVLVNIGAQTTNLTVCKNSIPYLVRDIPWGAEKFCRHTAEQLGMDPATLDLSKETAIPGLAEAMKAVAESLVTELQLSFDYFENRFGHPPGEIFVSGGLSQSSAFLNALKPHVTQPVTLWTPAQGLSGQFVVAFGLALRTD